MTYQEFKNKYIDKAVNVDGAYGAQCYDLVMAYMKEVWGIPNNLICRWSGGVRDFAEHFNEMFDTSKFQYEKNSANNVPPQGAVFVFANNQWGHTGIVDSANQDIFVSLDQNWGNGVDGSGQGDKRVRLVTHNYQTMLGWITPKQNQNNNNQNNNNQSDMALQQDLRNAIEGVQWDEGTKNALIGAVYSKNGQPDFGYILAFSGKAVRDDLVSVTNQVNDLKRQISDINNNSVSKADFDSVRVANSQLIDQIKNLQMELDNANQDSLSTNDQIINLQAQSDSLKQSIVNLQSTLTQANSQLTDKNAEITNLQAQIQSLNNSDKNKAVEKNSSNKNIFQSKKWLSGFLNTTASIGLLVFQSAQIKPEDDLQKIIAKLGSAVATVLGISFVSSSYISGQASIDKETVSSLAVVK
jgi:hypothetical protein